MKESAIRTAQWDYIPSLQVVVHYCIVRAFNNRIIMRIVRRTVFCFLCSISARHFMCEIRRSKSFVLLTMKELWILNPGK